MGAYSLCIGYSHNSCTINNYFLPFYQYLHYLYMSGKQKRDNFSGFKPVTVSSKTIVQWEIFLIFTFLSFKKICECGPNLAKLKVQDTFCHIAKSLFLCSFSGSLIRHSVVRRQISRFFILTTSKVKDIF